MSKAVPRRHRRRVRALYDEWSAADEAGDVARAIEIAEEVTRLAPDWYVGWFDAGLLAKARGDWTTAVVRNSRAVDLFDAEAAGHFDGVNPAAWNLGIAATALGDWATARRAWQAYGLGDFAASDQPLDHDLGTTPVRINPDRPSLPHQVLVDHGGTAVVWVWRRSPAHGVISSVPLPESGHRFRDVVLHDGAPSGTRRLGDQEVPVFDELLRLASSDLPTWQAVVSGADAEDLQALADLVGSRGLGLDDWSGIRPLCADCSHGSPDESHRHAPPPEDEQRLGLAGPEHDLRQCLEEWLAGRDGVTLRELTWLW
jgi:hypothetical protein